MGTRASRKLAFIWRLFAVLGLVAAACSPAPSAPTQPPAGQPKIPGAPSEIKVGLVTFLSGAASGPFGIPARTAAEVWVDKLNREGGIGGAQIKLVIVDENVPTDQQVVQLRRLALDEKVDLVIGYISSANCLAVAPVAEELKLLTVLFDCGTNQVFEEGRYKYVFRTAAHTGIDGIGAARYLLMVKPDVKTVAGINQDYAWGRDSWEIFIRALRKLKPDVQVLDTLWPRLQQNEFSGEISKLLSLKPEVVFTSFWGGDFVSFINQARARGVFDQTTILFNNDGSNIEEFGKDLPDGIIIGSRGPHWIEYPDPNQNPLQKEFIDLYRAKYGKYPMPHGSYHVVQALQGVKAAYEKAAQAAGRWPTVDEVIKAFEYLEFDSPSGRISMAIGYGHQAVEPAVYGITKLDPQLGFSRLDRVKVFPVKCVNPPDGVKTLDWIDQGFPGAQC